MKFKVDDVWVTTAGRKVKVLMAGEIVPVDNGAITEVIVFEFVNGSGMRFMREAWATRQWERVRSGPVR